MSNQAYSVSEDLMVGAGVLYFKRADDTNGWHHLGNVDEFNITNDVEKIDKNSSMNKKRELMASVVTSVKPSASLTLTEYNPYNLALGLYGTEGVFEQEAVTLASEPYTVPSVPGILTITDPDGNRYMDVRNITLAPSSSIPASFTAVTTGGSTLTPHTVTVAGDSYQDALGGIIQLNLGSWAGTRDEDVYFRITGQPSTAGDLNGLKVEAQVGIAGAVQTLTVSTTTTTATLLLGNGASLDFSVTASDNFSLMTGATTMLMGAQAKLMPAMTSYKKGVDYDIDEQESRAGVVKIKAGSRIKAGSQVLVNAEVPAKKFPVVNGGNAGDITGELLFIGDPNIGGQYNIEAWKVKVTPDGDMSGLIGTDFGSFNLNIDFLADYEHHPDAPYYRATMIGRADGKSDVATGNYDPNY